MNYVLEKDRYFLVGVKKMGKKSRFFYKLKISCHPLVFKMIHISFIFKLIIFKFIF